MLNSQTIEQNQNIHNRTRVQSNLNEFKKLLSKNDKTTVFEGQSTKLSDYIRNKQNLRLNQTLVLPRACQLQKEDPKNETENKKYEILEMINRIIHYYQHLRKQIEHIDQLNMLVEKQCKIKNVFEEIQKQMALKKHSSDVHQPVEVGPKMKQSKQEIIAQLKFPFGFKLEDNQQQQTSRHKKKLELNINTNSHKTLLDNNNLKLTPKRKIILDKNEVNEICIDIKTTDRSNSKQQYKLQRRKTKKGPSEFKLLKHSNTLVDHQ